MSALSQRIHRTRACSGCAPSGGIWSCDSDGSPRAGMRCNCRRGWLLAKADAGRARREGAAELVAYGRVAADALEIAHVILKDSGRYESAKVDWASREVTGGATA